MLVFVNHLQRPFDGHSSQVLIGGWRLVQCDALAFANKVALLNFLAVDANHSLRKELCETLATCLREALSHEFVNTARGVGVEDERVRRSS
jgi:hypothetical protein